jgi:hypothetical protein
MNRLYILFLFVSCSIYAQQLKVKPHQLNIEPIYIDTLNNRVGIGTNTPTTQITIEDDFEVNIRLNSTSTGANTNTGVIFQTPSDGHFTLQVGNAVSKGLRFYDNRAVAERLRIDSLGNVGIGTTSPSYKLDVAGMTKSRGVYNEIPIDASNGTGNAKDVTSVTASSLSSTPYYWKIATLWPSNSSQAEMLTVDYYGGYYMDKMKGSIIFKNRQGFAANHYVRHGNNLSGARIQTYTQTDGSVDVYIYIPTIYYILAVNMYTNSWTYGNTATLYTNPTRQTTTPTGTLSFDSYTNSSYTSILPNGNVGIGTTSPSAKLHILSNGSIDNGAEIYLQHNNNNTTDVVSTIQFANNGGSVAMIQGGTTGANNTGYISFSTDNAGTSSEKMIITGAGNVGIGTTSPVNKLDVRGIVNCTNSGAEATLQEVIRFARSDYPDFYHAIFASTGSGATRSNHKLEFRLNNSTSNGLFTSMTLVGNGNVGIGTTTPSYKLDVYQGDVATTGHSTGDLRLSGNLTGYGSYPTLKTTGPVIYFEADNTYTGYIGYNTGFIDVSDGTLKTFVEPIQNATDILMNLEGVRYSWIDGRDDFATHAGFVAQQVLEHYPEAVTLAETGIYGISSPPLIALAVATIQEQQQQIEELKTTIQSLITRIQNLENQ